MRQYYVQAIADNYLKNLVDAPESFKVHPSFLHGLEEEDFFSGYRALHSLMHALYEGIAEDPAAFGMTLKENNPPDAKSADYTQANASFLRVPNLLLLAGAKGRLNPDMSLSVGGGELLEGAKLIKITKPHEILHKLTDYGFEITGYGKTIKAGDTVIFAYPECRFLLTALVSMAEAVIYIQKGDLKKSKDLFYMLDPRILETDKPKAPKFTIDDICHVMNPAARAVARRFDGFISTYAKPTVKPGGFMRNDWGCVYNLRSDKRVILTLNVYQNTLSAKINLAHIGQYSDSLDTYPERVREVLTSSWECGGCHGSCAGGFAFSYGGKDYNKCRGGAFVFPDIDADTAEHCLSLLEREMNAETGA